MAINLPAPGIFNQPMTLPPPLFDRARPGNPLPEVPARPEPGSLVIVDSFQESWQGAGHGNVGAFAARQHGFRGQIYAEPIGPDAPAGMPTSLAARLVLNQPQSPEFTRQALQDVSRFRHRELLNDVAGDLDKLRERGLRDSAVNVSYGISPLRVADQMLADVRSGTDPMSPNHQFSQNVLRAYNIDAGKLASNDPNVAGPERQRLQQALLQAAEQGAGAPDVQQAQQNYDRSVQQLQGQSNSVVVSAGNQQQIAAQWTREAHGRAPVVGPSTNHNVLANSHVTTVGATQWLQGQGGLRERVAPYSNRDPEVDIYASGAVGNGPDVNRMNVDGTSYASPRVGAALATLHGTHPGATSAQMRNLMNNRLTHDLPTGESVLNFQRAEEYMRRGTF